MMSNVIEVDFKASKACPSNVRYPYIVSYCQHLGYGMYTLYHLLKQAEKDRPGRRALFKSHGVWQMLDDWEDQEQRDQLKQLTELRGLIP